MPPVACPCCGEIKSTEAIMRLLDIIASKCKVCINSVYRCEAHNRAVNGSRNSQHLSGNAADIYSPEYSIQVLYELCDELNPHGGVIVYPNHVHIDCRGYRYRADKR